MSCDDNNTWKKNQLQKSTDLCVSTALELPVGICLLAEYRSHKRKRVGVIKQHNSEKAPKRLTLLPGNSMQEENDETPF